MDIEAPVPTHAAKELWPRRLETYLDSLEDVIRGDLTDPRTARNWLRQMDLTDALEAVTTARAALAQCPDGARLAFAVLDASLSRVRLDVEFGNLRHQASRKASATTKAQRQVRAARLHAQIRGRAAKLSPDLSDTAKAMILKLAFPMSVRQIRRIIKKNSGPRGKR